MRLWNVYARLVRRFMPAAYPKYAGIRTAGTGLRFGDRWMGRLLNQPIGGDLPTYEQALVEGLNSTVRPGDSVLVVGGGFGVTATIAARLVGETGRVICIEGGIEQAGFARATAAVNRVADRLTVRHAYVGPPDQIYGSRDGAIELDIADLPDCDVLEMDCEGAERAILSAMRIRPRAILVECHGVFGAPTGEMHALLEGLGYVVDNFGVAEPHHEAHCLKNDVFVLRAVRP